jgi:LCP family protein required for cell wall assembly
MSEKAAPVAEDGNAPKRRGTPKKKHTVGRVLLATCVVLALVTGLGMIYLYRHLNGNLTVLDIQKQLTDRPAKHNVTGPQEPLNILVMGSDDRDGAGNNIDGLTGAGQRSDTTILFHLSADRTRAYGISIPRDSLVTRPTCKDAKGNDLPGGTDVMWNEAFNLGGPACTVQQFEHLTHVFVDHFVVVDFAGFESMVDAIGGVPVCIPEPVVDPAHGINIPAGTREIEGREALNYVRARYTLGDGSDISRIKRQQAFVASMAHKVISKGTLARVDRLVGFLNAATKSLTTDMDSIVKIAKIGVGFKSIGLDNFKFITVPIEYDQREEYRGRVDWVQPAANSLWKLIANDKPLPPKFLNGAITAAHAGGEDDKAGGKKPSDGPASGPSSPATGGQSAEEAAANGLCA